MRGEYGVIAAGSNGIRVIRGSAQREGIEKKEHVLGQCGEERSQQGAHNAFIDHRRTENDRIMIFHFR